METVVANRKCRTPAADDDWAPFGPSSLVLPELLLSVTPDGMTLTGSLVGADTADARTLEHRWARLAERARSLAPSPIGMVARPVFAPLITTEEQPPKE